jgi:hypothetical protein
MHMFPISKFLDVHVSALSASSRWFGIERVAPGKGSIGLGFAVVAYSLSGSDRMLEHRRLMAERVDPWLSGTD